MYASSHHFASFAAIIILIFNSSLVAPIEITLSKGQIHF
jgi:hypothetical protein